MLPLKSVSRSDAYFTRYGTAKLVAWLASASQDASYANFKLNFNSAAQPPVVDASRRNQATRTTRPYGNVAGRRKQLSAPHSQATACDPHTAPPRARDATGR